MGFLGIFLGPKGQFPVKNHISGYHIKKYRFLKNRIFRDFLRFLRFLLMQIMAGIGQKWPGI